MSSSDPLPLIKEELREYLDDLLGKEIAKKYLKAISTPMEEYTLHVLETPGHSPGSLSYYCKDIKEINGAPIDGIIFTGDLLFRRSIGRSDVLGGDQGVLFNSIKTKIMYNPEITDNFLVFPGHMGNTSVGEERKLNMFKRGFL